MIADERIAEINDLLDMDRSGELDPDLNTGGDGI